LEFIRVAQGRVQCYVNELSGPIKGREFLEQVTDYQRLKDTVAWS